MARKPKPPRGPRNLKAGGFTNGLWRLEERARLAATAKSAREAAEHVQEDAKIDPDSLRKPITI